MNCYCENCGWSEIVGSSIMCNYSGHRTWRDGCCEAWKPKEKETNVVEVIRCKDCKHRDPENHKCDCGHDIQWQLPREDNWFCADGERR